MQNKPTSSRVARRRANQRAAILQAASYLFANHGPEAVRLDDIADKADVSRGTLYSHFVSKEELIRAIVTPILETAVAETKKLTRGSARQRIGALLQLYLNLWANHQDALRLSHRLRNVSLADSAKLHQAFHGAVLDVLSYAARARILRTTDPNVACRMIMRVTVPMLEVCSSHPQGQEMFVQGMCGLLTIDPKPDTKKHSAS